MKTLYESILGDIDTTLKKGSKEVIKEIKDFLSNIFSLTQQSKFKISKKPNKDGKYVVDFKGKHQYDTCLTRYNFEAASITNGLFIFGKCEGSFDLRLCKGLKTLEGCPEYVSGDFICQSSKLLTSLEHAPKEVGGDFCCNKCGKQFSEAEIKKISNVKGKIIV